ncbi:MAG: hypothetical protein WCT19_03860 [Candidatus Paceibacterota bacterium]
MTLQANKYFTVPIAAALFIFAAFFPPFQIFAQTSSGMSAVLERQAALEQELANVQKQIDDQTAILNTKQRESVTLERDIDILNAKIERSRLSIKALDLTIQQLSSQIGNKNQTIDELTAKIEREKESLAQILRKTSKIDDFSLPEIALSGQNMSQFFEDVDSFTSIKLALRDSFTTIANDKAETQSEKDSLEEKKSEESDLKNLQTLEKKRTEQQTAEKKNILKISKGVEAEYQKIIAAKQKDAAAIRAELFTLRGSKAIPFEKAYEYAVVSGKKTGVRPALILGIIAEESNLGENVGTGNWKVDMKAPRDTEPFKIICAALGLNPDTMPVSKKPWYGYGGAMGPAQFIPSTWVLYQDKIAAATGHNPPNPWDPQDAFMASAILLKENGASAGTPAAERLAALRYLAGWTNASKKAYAFYGNDVMDLAAKYQQQINIINS